jgi:glycerophosphoryl diester phosphodiesterase
MTDLSAILEMPRRPLVIAHRAGNGRASARMATELGVELLEADVWRFRGRLELRHSKTVGPLPILWDRWSLDGPWAARPTVEDVLDALDPSVSIMFDIKGRDPLLPRHLIETLDRLRPGQPVLVCSQHWRQLARFLPYPNAVLVHSVGNRRQLERVWPLLLPIEHDAISIHIKLLDSAVVRALKERVGWVFSWPINSRELAHTAIAWGVDGLITDVPDAMVEIRDELAAPQSTGTVKR